VTIADRAWTIATQHVPYFETTWAPARNAILSAIVAALKEPPPPVTDFDDALAAIDRADARQGPEPK
jgi:hypothetical protein